MGTGYNLDMPSFWIVTYSHVEEIIYKLAGDDRAPETRLESTPHPLLHRHCISHSLAIVGVCSISGQNEKS